MVLSGFTTMLGWSKCSWTVCPISPSQHWHFWDLNGSCSWTTCCALVNPLPTDQQWLAENYVLAADLIHPPHKWPGMVESQHKVGFSIQLLPLGVTIDCFWAINWAELNRPFLSLFQIWSARGLQELNMVGVLRLAQGGAPCGFGPRGQPLWRSRWVPDKPGLSCCQKDVALLKNWDRWELKALGPSVKKNDNNTYNAFCRLFLTLYSEMVRREEILTWDLSLSPCMLICISLHCGRPTHCLFDGKQILYSNFAHSVCSLHVFILHTALKLSDLSALERFITN